MLDSTYERVEKKSAMIHFACVSCDRRHKVHASMAGAKVKCPCGQIMLVPAEAANEMSRPVTDKIKLSCVCGKQLLAPATSVGKSMRCPCGETLLVAGAEEPPIASEYSATPANEFSPSLAGDQDFFNEVAFPSQQRNDTAAAGDWFSSSAQTTNNNSTPYGSANYSPPYYGANNGNSNTSANSSYTHDYLRFANQERQTRNEDDHVMVTGDMHAARWTLTILGLLIMFFNFVFLVNSSAEAEAFARESVLEGDAVDLDLLLLFVRIYYIITICVGIVFIVLGAMVNQYPVAAPSIGLAIYGLGILLFLILDPLSMISPFSIGTKFAIIGTLVKAINSGAYAKHRASTG